MAESKVKSHIRRSKDGKASRVKEGKRKSLGKKIAIAGATGVGLVGLGLAGRKLTKEVIKRKAMRDFNPKPDDRFIIGNYDGKIKGTSTLADSQIRLERARQVASFPKKNKNQYKVLKRRSRLVNETSIDARDSTIAPGRGYREPSFSPDRNTRRLEGERISKAAKALAYKKGRFKK